MIAPGKYFETGSIIRNHLTGLPLLCVSVSKTRVYYHRLSRDGSVAPGNPSFCNIKTVGYVTNTHDELREICEAASANFKKYCEMKRELSLELNQTVATIRKKHQ